MVPIESRKLDVQSARTRLRHRKTATIVGCLSVTVSTALVVASTIARAIDCRRPGAECTGCFGRLRLYHGLMLAFSILFIASLIVLLAGRFILFPAPAVEFRKENSDAESSSLGYESA